MSSGISSRQGGHHVAQKLSSTTFPCQFAVETTFPSMSRTRNAGAGCGLLASRTICMRSDCCAATFRRAAVPPVAGACLPVEIALGTRTRSDRPAAIPIAIPASPATAAKIKIKYFFMLPQLPIPLCSMLFLRTMKTYHSCRAEHAPETPHSTEHRNH
jgi:hypothetical protein